MKGINRIYGITIAFLALWIVINADAPTKCPYPSEEFPENTTTNIAHEIDCTKFYKCHVGKGVEQKCPLMNKDDDVSRLHFNREKQVCDWPWEAGCDACPPKINNEWPDAKLPAENGDCRKYYVCVRGNPEERLCAAGTCFSRTCQDCVKNREGGNCGSLPPSTTTTTSRRPPTPPPVCQPDGDRQQHDCNCVLYYECHIDLGWVQETCRGGLHFSPTEKRCMTPDKAGCKVLNE
ncbi:peritrophin-1 [Linepithema humile]|uniref:peritrophin-1 n=1 Tax=Linepithema humile TaxID=83485 RepID=UPI000623165F|nr:PREDICTED: peritrophin-1-like [Linepithema humile]